MTAVFCAIKFISIKCSLAVLDCKDFIPAVQFDFFHISCASLTFTSLTALLDSLNPSLLVNMLQYPEHCSGIKQFVNGIWAELNRWFKQSSPTASDCGYPELEVMCLKMFEFLIIKLWSIIWYNHGLCAMADKYHLCMWDHTFNRWLLQQCYFWIPGIMIRKKCEFFLQQT